MDNLKAVFAYSSDIVIITDYNFNILWINKEDDIFSFYGENCSSLFEKREQPLKSGVYYIKHNGLYYECRLINYPDCREGVYVIQTSGDDVIYSFANCKGVREVLENQSGATREAVTGIGFSNEHLRRVLADVGEYEEQKHFDIIAGNCCKLLKTSVNILELFNYSDDYVNKYKIDLSAILEQFVSESVNVLREKIRIKTNIQPQLYVKADPERISAFLLSMVRLANGGNSENNVIVISAERTDDYVSLTVASDRCGVDTVERRFTKHVNLHNGDELNTDMYIVNRFCKIFSATLFVSEKQDNSRSFSVRLPYDDSSNGPLVFKTAYDKYDKNIFSKYRVAYSDLIY